MVTSSTGILARASAATRASIPSYLPQPKTRWLSLAYSVAISCVNGTPAGLGSTSRAGRPDGIKASRASPHGSGRITMPGPPPNGASSTEWCASCVHVLRSCTPNWMSPRSAALPISETPSGAKYSGKMVMMSIRTRTPCLARRAPAAQPGGRVDDQAPGRDVDLRHDGRHQRHQYLTMLPGGPAFLRLDHHHTLPLLHPAAPHPPP